jgi:hypothetical protein
VVKIKLKYKKNGEWAELSPSDIGALALDGEYSKTQIVKGSVSVSGKMSAAAVSTGTENVGQIKLDTNLNPETSINIERSASKYPDDGSGKNLFLVADISNGTAGQNMVTAGTQTDGSVVVGETAINQSTYLLETQPAIKFTPGTDGNGATWYLNEGEINGGALDVAHGGTGATTAAAALSNIGAAPASHTHAASDVTSGTLAVARGGTGLSASPSMLTNLASTAAASVLQASPRPGVTGVLPVANGGTGASTADAACAALSIDQIVYSGTSSDWACTKYASGLCICFQKITRTIAVSDFNNWGEYQSSYAAISLPFEMRHYSLICLPSRMYSIRMANYGSTNTFNYTLTTMTAPTSDVDITLRFAVVGTWK